MKTKRLKILENSLIKKENLFNEKLQNHINTVKQANGQPLNDKRNGQATLNKWEKQNDSLRNLNDSIRKTKDAIEREQGMILDVEQAKKIVPNEILKMIESGELIQWRKHPTFFFVKGVDKARILWDNKRKVVAYRYLKSITDKEQFKLFAKTYNTLNNALNKQTSKN